VSLLDRIDIHIEVPRADYEKLGGDRVGETSDAVHAYVQAVLAILNNHFSIKDLRSRLEQCAPIRESAIEKDYFCILIAD